MDFFLWEIFFKKYVTFARKENKKKYKYLGTLKDTLKGLSLKVFC